MKNIIILLLLSFNYCISQSSDVFSIARNGTVKDLKILMKKNDEIINLKNENGFTPLILACYKGNFEVAEFLINKSKSINVSSPMGTPLMAATVKGDVTLVKLLLENKANPDLTDEKGMTALMYAVQFRNKEIVNLLLNNKASKTLINNEGKTAFEYAVFTDNDDIINLLK